jgi:serine/threonine-protein kinase
MVQAGDLLAGKYTLEARLGAGAMGEVWKAQHKDLGRPVAIKILKSEHLADRNIVARFLREARAANIVRHTNVVDVIDVGEDTAGVPFLVQELLEGEDLGAHLAARGHGLPFDAATRVLIPIVEAIAFAHGRGVVHRDIKPENVFLARTGDGVVPKLLDFGISHVAVEGATRMTATGVSLGTPAYMAPEQIKGARQVDTRSDVWALGVLMHETLSGRLPFKGDTVGELFVQIATEDPTPLEVAAPHLPTAMCRIVAKCLKRSPTERYQDARTLLFDLEAVAAGSRPARPALALGQVRLGVAADRREAATDLGNANTVPPDPPPLEILPLSAPLPRREAVALPASRVARFHSLRPDLGDGAGHAVLVAIAMTAATLLGAGLVASLNVLPEDWAPGSAISALLAQSWPPGARLGGPLSAVVAALAGAVAIRRATRSWLDDVRSDALLFGALATATFVVARLLVR